MLLRWHRRLFRSAWVGAIAAALAMPPPAFAAASGAPVDGEVEQEGSSAGTLPRDPITPQAEPTPPESAETLLQRAEIRRAAGDETGSVALLADALERTRAEDVEPRTEAKIRLTLLDIHEVAGRRDVANQIRAALLRDRGRLQLTAAEIERLRQGEVPEPTTSEPEPPVDAATTSPGDKDTAVKQKVIEQEILSDRKMISAGIGMVTVGLGFGLGGAVLLVSARATEQSLDEFKIPDQEQERRSALRDGAAQNGAGIAFVAIGGVLVLAGVTLMGVGYGRKRKRLGKGRRSKAARVQPTVTGVEVKF